MEQNLDLKQIMKMAQSPAGQQLIQLLQQQGGMQLQSAVQKASSGNLQQAKQALSILLDNPEVKKLLQQLEENQ